MELFEVIVALLLAAACLSAFADKIGVPYPALLAIAGTVAAFIPGVPTVTPHPELALALFVAPTLLDSAYDASPRDLKDNLVSVSSLALVAVAVTIAAVTVVARICVPEMSVATAVTLGAIIAPPDASAANAVLRRLHPPHRIMVILEGESLFNDASALLVYRLAVTAAVAGTSISVLKAGPLLLLTCGGGALVGWVLAHVSFRLSAHIFHKTEIAISVLVQFLTTFGVWLLAEKLHLSAIITVVVYAMTIARSAPRTTTARRRISSYAVWEVAVFVLNALAFLLIGLQMRSIIQRLDDNWRPVAILAAACCGTVVIARVAWVMTYNVLMRTKMKIFGAHVTRGKPRPAPTVKGSLLVSWSGMRGIVTLATALALPAEFPQRDAVVFASVCVVLFTLGLQGLTLGPLLRLLDLRDDGEVEQEVATARRATAKAAIASLERAPSSDARELLVKEYGPRCRESSAVEEGKAPNELAKLQSAAVDAQRDALEKLRREGTIGDDAFHVIEEELDLLELTADPRVRTL